MKDKNQLPEPELGYIQTDKSNQPAFSARQMREAQQPATPEPVAWIVPDFGFLFPSRDAARRYLKNIGSTSHPTPIYTHPAPPVQDALSLLKSLGPKPWETSPEAHAQARLIGDFESAMLAAKESK